MVLDKYLRDIQSLVTEAVPENIISLGPGGWPAWKRLTTDTKAAVERCSRLATSVNRGLCKYRIKVAEARRKSAFLKGINCSMARDLEPCEQEISDQVEVLTRSLENYEEKIKQLLIKIRG